MNRLSRYDTDPGEIHAADTASPDPIRLLAEDIADVKDAVEGLGHALRRYLGENPRVLILNIPTDISTLDLNALRDLRDAVDDALASEYAQGDALPHAPNERTT